jgi:hypothetical protein
MVRHPSKIACLLLALGALASCGGGGKKKPTKPVPKPDTGQKAPPPPETEADREAKRHDAALAMVPEGSTCLPASLKKDTAPQLQLAAIGGNAVLCAVDTERQRLLGVVACWKVDLAKSTLEYLPPKPIPGRGFGAKIDSGCVRGYCLPKGTKTSEDGIAHIVWTAPETGKVAVLVGEEVHVFNAGTKSHDKTFSIRGDKGVTNEPSDIHWVGNAIYIEGHDAGPYATVFVFKPDGTPVGPIQQLAAKEKDQKPVSTYGGSFMLLDKNRVAAAEQGFTAVTIYESDTGKRTKLNRKISNGPCKKDELESFWLDQDDKVSKKCKDHMAKMFGHLIGADMVAGNKNLLALLRGPRLGELAVLDPKTLTEKKAFILPWCTGDEKPAVKEKAEDKGAAKDEAKDDAKPDKKATTRAPKPKNAKEEDPDAGGE